MYPIHLNVGYQLEPFRACTGPAVLYAQVRCHPRVFHIRAHLPPSATSSPRFAVTPLMLMRRMSHDFDLQEQ
ncbi:MAG: hypothetical protein IT323_12995 [Anaerolineae bacterium]|nr:hypothetical protein [Anaerolineae bacterium]